MKFEQGRQQDNLYEAISLNRQALDLRPPLHPFRATSLHAIGKMLIYAHSEMGNNLECLEQAMSSFVVSSGSSDNTWAVQLRRRETGEER